MLTVFFNSSVFRQSHNVIFVYRNSNFYRSGFISKLKIPIYTEECKIVDPDNLAIPIWLNNLGTSLVFRILVKIIKLPIFLIDIWKLYKIFFRLKPEILHINNGGYPGALSARAAVIAAKYAKIDKVVMVVNNIAVDYSLIRRKVQRPLDILVRNRVDLFITGSKYASLKLVEVLGLDSGKICNIWNGVEVPSDLLNNHYSNYQNDPSTPFVLGMVGHLIERKGHFVALQAVSKFIESAQPKVGEFKLIIEGSGPLAGEITRAIQNLNLSDFVFMENECEDIFALIARFDALLLTSIANEDLPNVISEAMALGKPVIASRLAGIPEQIDDGETGFLCTVSDTIAFAKAIEMLFSDQDLCLKFGNAAKQRYLENFKPETAVLKYLSEYDRLGR